MTQLIKIGTVGGRIGKLLTLSILLSSVTGCFWSTAPELVKPYQQNLLKKCPELSKHDGTTGKDVLATLLNWADEYNDCAVRHNGLVDAVSAIPPVQ